MWRDLAGVWRGDRLSPNASLPNSLVYSPIEDWSNDQVWLYLMHRENPWGHSNKEPFQDPRTTPTTSLLGADEWNLLQHICTEINADPMHFELITRLLGTEQHYQRHTRRVGIFDALEKCFESSSRNKEEAIGEAKAEREVKEALIYLHVVRIAQIHHSDDLKPVKQVLSGWAVVKFGDKGC